MAYAHIRGVHELYQIVMADSDDGAKSWLGNAAFFTEATLKQIMIDVFNIDNNITSKNEVFYYTVLDDVLSLNKKQLDQLMAICLDTPVTDADLISLSLADELVYFDMVSKVNMAVGDDLNVPTHKGSEAVKLATHLINHYSQPVLTM